MHKLDNDFLTYKAAQLLHDNVHVKHAVTFSTDEWSQAYKYVIIVTDKTTAVTDIVIRNSLNIPLTHCQPLVVTSGQLHLLVHGAT